VWVDDFQRIVAELVEQPDQPAWLVPMRSDRSGADEDPREESPMGRRRDGAPFSERNDTAAGGLAARVAEIWAGVLGVEVIPPRATFFELGGHSLLAIRLLNRIKDSLSVDLPLTTLFTHSSIEDFTARVAEELSVHGGSDDASIEAPSEAPAEVLDALLADVESMSDEEALALLTALEDGGEQ
jgi:acyl carrier protein